VTMAAEHDSLEKGLASGENGSGSEGKGRSQQIDDIEKHPNAAPAVVGDSKRALEAPEFLRHMTLEERLAVETRLMRKIDARLMPMIILMYIMNYLDRVSGRHKTRDRVC